ncbi:MAG: type II toxin-antitoxin system HipA family toxin [Prevotella sp.]|nr:type II toxin-antitoxin system HipA family toxin [Prevotella sp.]
MQDVSAVSVTYHGRKVGIMSVAGRGTCQFEYDKEWLQNGFSISPLQLPLKSGLFTADYVPFGGNFGIFEDSLPGGYGQYLLLKVLRRSGVDYRSLSPVQRLSIIGSSGMGALCYHPENIMLHDELSMSLDELQQAALDVLSEKTEEDAGTLYVKSGNSGGARPKCVYTDSDGHWLVKFRHTYDPKDIGQQEYYYNEVARKCGIDVPDFKLMEGKYFAVRRFDLADGVRLHVATASGLLNEPITPPKMDYHSLLQLTGYLTQSVKAVEQQFRRMVFNHYAHNYDDHARNFSFVCREGEWALAPAYDLTYDNTLGEHASTINFQGNPTDDDMITVGTNAHLTPQCCRAIIEEVRDVTRELQRYFI